MLPKIAPVARIIGIATRQQSKRCTSSSSTQAAKSVTRWKTDKHVAIDEKSHMNYMPVPQGSWKDHYEARNSKWEMMLGSSIAFFFGTCFIANEFRCFYLHGSPVPCPGSPPDAKKIGKMHPAQLWY